MIGIITSGAENYNLIKLCQQSDISFCILADTQGRPHQDKTQEYLNESIQKLITQAKHMGCTHVLLPPSLELYHHHITQYDTQEIIIIPLFAHYIEYCFEHSLIGKIGYIGGYSDRENIEKIHPLVSKIYQKTTQQIQTKHFQYPLSKRTKDTSMREYFLRLLSPRQMMINKIIKTDLKYFKDANVDTIIPLNYSYFNFQTTISNYFNPKKQKFHKRDVLATLFQKLIPSYNFTPSKHKTVTLYHTGSLHLFSEQKKWERLLSQGNKLTIEYKKISLS